MCLISVKFFFSRRSMRIKMKQFIRGICVLISHQANNLHVWNVYVGSFSASMLSSYQASASTELNIYSKTIHEQKCFWCLSWKHRTERNSFRVSMEVICQTRKTTFHRDILTPRRELEIRHAAEYFCRNSRRLDSRWITVFRVWYIFSIETKTKE